MAAELLSNGRGRTGNRQLPLSLQESGVSVDELLGLQRVIQVSHLCLDDFYVTEWFPISFVGEPL